MMATATEYAGTGFARSPPMSGVRSLDTASSIYPERAIRPLPKSRLKSKLSPQQASTIVYPPDPPPISPTLNFSLPENAAPSQHRRLTNGDSHHDHHAHVVHDHCTCGEHDDSGDDEVEFDHPDYRYPPAPVANGISVKPVDSLQRRLIDAARAGKPPPPGSTASSADGYESFENTSNKKKRKIPLSGASSMHQSSLSAEMASMGISGSHADGVRAGAVVNGAGDHDHYNGQAASASTAPGTGISGAGRGRFGRQDGRNRRPLGSSTMNSINGYNSRASPRGSDAKNGNDTGIENTGGIISQAIKTAAEQGPLTPAGKGRDSVSLLQSAASATNSATTPKTQFTFTCESDSATKMVDQQAHPYAAGTPTPNRNAPAAGKSTHSTQTTPPLRGHHPNNAGRPPPPPSNATSYAGHQQPQAPPPKPRPRRNPTKEYALQAANRKRNQQYQNFHHRPNLDEMWVCEFCEYEDIFGVPPYAMIRRYEIKDRQERKKAAEKRRLLEKAKMKGRKNKKGAGKGKNNNGNDAPGHAPPVHPQNYDPNLPPPEGEEDYYDDDDDDAYDQEGDEYDAGGAEHYNRGSCPPPVPAGTPATPIAGGGTRPHV